MLIQIPPKPASFRDNRFLDQGQSSGPARATRRNQHRAQSEWVPATGLSMPIVRGRVSGCALRPDQV